MNERRKKRAGQARTESAAAGRATALFEQFSLDWLRTLARGEAAGEATASLMAFAECAQVHRIPWRDPIEAAAGALEQRCALCAAASPLDAAMFDMARAALLLVAEALAQDRLAAARRSTRSLDLHRAAAAFIRACEQQAKSEGWSYLDLLVRAICDKPPAP